MKLKSSPLLLALILTLTGGTLAHAAEPAPTAAGYWEGEIALPNRELGIRVELTRGASSTWQGTIDIPLQGMRGFKLDAVKVDGATVAFALPGVPGEPQFAGKLAADGKSMAGDYSQGGRSTTFKLERKVKPAPTPEETIPASGVPGKGLAGHWRGSIKPIPGVELRLSLEIAQAATGKPEGFVVSLDQGNSRIPITALSETDGAVDFETASVGGTFKGRLNAEGSELAGDWSQGGRSTPLVFKRLPKAAGAGGAAQPR